jgi:cell division protein FtsZ
LLETSIEGARGVLLSITHGPTFGVHELQEASKVITASADEDARVIFGTVYNEKMKDEIKITVVATGFDRSRSVSDQYERGYTPTPFVAQNLPSQPANQQPANQAINQSRADFVPKPKVSPVKAAQAEPARKVDAFGSNATEEDDELGIPSFIRKKMM